MTKTKKKIEKWTYTPKDLATTFGITVQAVYKWVRQGRVKAIKVGHEWRISESEYHRIMREGI